MANEVAKPAEQTGALVRPENMICMAIEKGASPEALSQLMTLWERMKRIEAEAAYATAFTRLQSELPEITKDVKVKYSTGRGKVEYCYASLGNIWRTIKDKLSEYGFSVRFEPQEDPQHRRIGMTCVVAHEAGHRTQATVWAPADTSGAKNDIQAVGSTLKYLQRYALVAALGLCTTDDDMDGVRIVKDLGGTPEPPPPQAKAPWKEELGEQRRGKVLKIQDETEWWTWHNGKPYTLGSCRNAPPEEQERLRAALKGATWFKLVEIEGIDEQLVTRSNPKDKSHPWGVGDVVAFRDVGERQIRVPSGGFQTWREIREVRPVKEEPF